MSRTQRSGSISLMLGCLLLAVGSGRANAEPGIGPRSILLGQSAAFSGPAGNLGREFRQGAHFYFDRINAKGGVHGRQIVMVYRDDRYNPTLTRKHTQELIDKEKVFALFGYVGTATTQAALPLIQAHRIPLLAPVSGARLLREPTQPMVFNIRASYEQEIDRIIRYLVRYGHSDIAVVVQQDSFGQDGQRASLRALARYGLKPTLLATVPRNSRHTEAVAHRVALAQPDAVLIISAYTTVANFIENLRRQGSDAGVMSVSFVGSRSLSDALPASLRHGTGISQVVPFPWNARVPVVKEYQNIIRSSTGGSRYGFSSLEGFLAAKILVQALEKAGPQPTRAGLIRALESMGNHDLGGFRIHFSPNNHAGSDFVQLTFLMGSSGAFIH